jgi:hypothetical protein
MLSMSSENLEHTDSSSKAGPFSSCLKLHCKKFILLGVDFVALVPKIYLGSVDLRPWGHV